MTESPEPRRPRPSERFSASERPLDLIATLRALRAETAVGVHGHRQIALLHDAHVRLVLFAFEADGYMKEHAAPGRITIHVLRGALLVRTADAEHRLLAGSLLSLEATVRHALHALEETDMLLGVYPEA